MQDMTTKNNFGTCLRSWIYGNLKLGKLEWIYLQFNMKNFKHI